MSHLSRSAKAVVIALCTGLLFTADAWAGGFNVKTSLTIKAPSEVDAGDTFHIRGRLKSSKAHCRAHKTVKLIKKGHGVIDTDETTKKGKYRFSLSINSTKKFHTRFAGSVTGVHPNIKICRASNSKTVTVQTS
jgi:hypothetical protein